MPNKAIIIGSINMDIVAFVEQHPKVGETIFGSEVKYFPGGKGANQAVACKRLGCETMMVGRVGKDTFGKQLIEFQHAEGIDCGEIKQVDHVATGSAFITVSKSGDNTIVVIPGANAVWDDTFLDALNINRGDLVIAQFEVPDHVIAKAFKQAKACGASTLLNPAPVRNINDGIRQHTDILVINEVELAELSELKINIQDDHSVDHAMQQLKQKGFEAIVTTLGDRGVRLMNSDGSISISARQVNAVDTTGAGDTFIGGLAAGLLSGQSLSEAAEFGNRAASISVTRKGAATSIPTLEEVRSIE